MGISIVEKHKIQRVNNKQIILEHIVSAKNQTINAQHLVLVTARRPLSSLYFDLDNDADSLDHAGIKSVTRIGDCLAPSTIAAAVYHGHRFAREFDQPMNIDQVPFKREYVEI